MDAIDVLKEDHRTVEGMFGKVESLTAENAEERHGLVRDTIREVVIHASIEERVLYPVIRDSVPNGEELVNEHLRDHAEVEQVLKELEEGDPGSTEYEQKLGRLMQDVRQHVEEEENETLPQLQQSLSPDRLQQLGTELQKAKESAPTRPHPKAPSGEVKKMTDPGAAMVDRARDVIEGR